MNSKTAIRSMLTITLLLLVLTTQPIAAQVALLPNPVLYFVGQEAVTVNGKQVIRYRFDVDNKDRYPADFFEPSPKLPPCGTTTSAARTWVDIYDQSGKRLNGFCALAKPADLNGIWFALEVDVVPPSWVYIELNDRKTNTKYKSNLADTVL